MVNLHHICFFLGRKVERPVLVDQFDQFCLSQQQEIVPKGVKEKKEFYRIL
jgi:hypothetical protein